MANLILILGMLMPQIEASKNNQKVEEPQAIEKPKAAKKEVSQKKIKKGMSTLDLIDVLGTPSRVDHGSYGLSGKEYDRFYYEDAPCISQFKSCTVDMVNNEVDSFIDVKPLLFL